MQSEKSSLSLIAQYNPKEDKELVFAFTCDPDDILDLFERVSSKLGFELIERQSSYSTSIKKREENSGFRSILSLLGCLKIEGVTAIKVSLSKQSQKGKISDNYIAELRGLAGDNNQVSRFVSAFSEGVLKQGLASARAVLLAPTEDGQEKIDIENETPYYLQACSYHLVNKLLLDQKHPLGAKLQSLLGDFISTFKNLQQSMALLPLPMKNASSIVSELCGELEQLLTKMNYPKQLSIYTRISLQKLVFSRLQTSLFGIYYLRGHSSEQAFVLKRKKIIETYTIADIVEEVCLNPAFHSFNQLRKTEILSEKELKREIYFCSACKEFEKIVFTHSPREKIKFCQLAYSGLKNHFWDFSKRKYQLSSMQDIIPVLIVVILLVSVGNLRAELDIMLDFIASDPQEMQAQKRLLINLSESYNYIVRDWKIVPKS